MKVPLTNVNNNKGQCCQTPMLLNVKDDKRQFWQTSLLININYIRDPEQKFQFEFEVCVLWFYIDEYITFWFTKSNRFFIDSGAVYIELYSDMVG